MKKAIVIMLLTALVFAGCSSKPPVVSDPDMPPWINEQPPEGMLWGIGVSSNAQQNMRLTMADAAARQDLARQLQVLAQGMVTDYAREAGGIDNTAAMQFQETVSRQIAQANLQGAARDLVWTTPDKKTLWMRLKLSKADAAKTTAEQAQKAIDSEAARYAEFKAMDALKMMEQQLDKNSTSPQPVRN
ncbi:MAG: hypothetical protein LBP29_07750 [Treponema sp.]|jgi:hypothetical protein|nr:hypothetical protein [Treponema sp.]